MKTKKEYFRDAYENERRESVERKVKWRNEILEEINGWSYTKLKEEYINLRLAKISYYNPFPSGTVWNIFKEECRFCGMEYIYGHETCCDDCWKKNKSKTLEELNNE